MSLNASKVESKVKKNRAPALEPGTYPARVVWVVAIGLQPQNYYEEAKPPANEIMVTYELLDEFLEDEDGNEDETKPRFLSESFVLHSLDSDLATSTKRYFALDPKKEFGGDWSLLVNTPCMLTVIAKPSKKDNSIVYNNITGVSGMREKDAKKAPDLVNPSIVFDIDEPDMELFWKLPPFMRNKMVKDNLEFEGSVLEKAIEEFPQPEQEEKETKKETKKKTKKPKKEKVDDLDDDDIPW